MPRCGRCFMVMLVVQLILILALYGLYAYITVSADANIAKTDGSLTSQIGDASQCE